VHHAPWASESTYLVLPSKEAPPHVSNQAAVSFLPLALSMIVSVRQVIVSTRHAEKKASREAAPALPKSECLVDTALRVSRR